MRTIAYFDKLLSDGQELGQAASPIFDA